MRHKDVPRRRTPETHVLGIVYRCIATHLIKKAEFLRKTSQTGAVTLMQRFGSALDLNVHFAVHGRTNAADAWMCRSGPYAEDAVTRRHHPRHLRVTGLHCPAGSLGARTAGQPHPTRFHRVSVPNSKHRARVTRAKRGRGGQQARTAGPEEHTVERRAAMTWAQRVRRVFGFDIETCPACGGAMRIIACISGNPSDISTSIAHTSRVTCARRQPGMPCHVPAAASHAVAVARQ